MISLIGSEDVGQVVRRFIYWDQMLMKLFIEPFRTPREALPDVDAGIAYPWRIVENSRTLEENALFFLVLHVVRIGSLKASYSRVIKQQFPQFCY